MIRKEATETKEGCRNFKGESERVYVSRGLSFNNITEMSDPGIKRFFACGGLMLCVLIKEILDRVLKKSHPSKFFACGRLILCVFNLEKILSIQKCPDSGEYCNLGTCFRVVEEPLILAIK